MQLGLQICLDLPSAIRVWRIRSECKEVGTMMTSLYRQLLEASLFTGARPAVWSGHAAEPQDQGDHKSSGSLFVPRACSPKAARSAPYLQTRDFCRD